MKWFERIFVPTADEALHGLLDNFRVSTDPRNDAQKRDDARRYMSLYDKRNAIDDAEARARKRRDTDVLDDIGSIVSVGLDIASALTSDGDSTFSGGGGDFGGGGASSSWSDD